MNRGVKILLLALTYAIAGKLGLKLAFLNPSTTAVWAPAGIALAALLILGYRVWPGILLGAFAVNIGTAGTILKAFTLAGGSTLEGLLAAYLVNRFAYGPKVLREEMAERERTQQALHASEIRFRRLMESNVIGIISVDGDGRISEANEAFLKLLGYKREDLRDGALSTRNLTPVEYQTQEEWALEQMNARGSCPSLEKEFIHSGGSRIPVLVGGVRIEQSPPRYIYFVIDATHRRQAMEALRKAYDEIEVRVEKRTEELSQVNLELSKEIARRKQAETELRTLSLEDPLTGLYNRRGFLALAEQQWLQAFRDKRPFLFFFADVDGLKSINDSLGHPRGDQALMEAAAALRKTFRKSDILARIGGDEFAVVASQAPLQQIQTYLDRLQLQFDAVNAESKLPFKLALSIGVAVFDQKETTSIQELMRRADEDLYARKQARRAVR